MRTSCPTRVTPRTTCHDVTPHGITSESFSMHTSRLVRPPSCSGGGFDLALAALASAPFCLLSAELADRTSLTCIWMTPKNGKGGEESKQTRADICLKCAPLKQGLDGIRAWAGL